MKGSGVTLGVVRGWVGGPACLPVRHLPFCEEFTASCGQSRTSAHSSLQQSQLWPVSALPLSFVFCAVVSASALIIDVSPCIGQTEMDRPWEVCRTAGWGARQAPTHCVGLNLLQFLDHSKGNCLQESISGPRPSFCAHSSAELPPHSSRVPA